MTPDTFREILRQTLSDSRVTRTERQALRATLEQLRLADTQWDNYRHIAFDLAREELQGSPGGDVLDWLEEVVKLLKPPEECDQRVQSEAYFSPGNACRHRIRSLFQHARHTADVCVFTITDDEITETIFEAHRRGVRIRIITDNDKSFDTGSDIDRLAAGGVEVRVDDSPHHMHHKFAIFDNNSLLCGSYNWTRSAARNNEENIVVLDDRDLLTRFSSLFEELWARFDGHVPS